MPDHLTRAALALDPTLTLPEPTTDELVCCIRYLKHCYQKADANADDKFLLMAESLWDAPSPIFRHISQWPREKQLRLIILLSRELAENEH